MRFPDPLVDGILVRRYKRFLADVRLADGSVVTAHCTNTGSMKMCAEPGWRVLLSPQDRPDRKLKFTWELVHNGQCWIGVNTMTPNRIAAEAIREGRIPELAGYPELATEKRYGQNSRVDILLSDGERRCYVEVKNVTLLDEDGRYCFPDAVTLRGRKHLAELEQMVRDGYRAAMLYVIQRSDGQGFRPASHIDPAYAEAVRHAYAAGVEMLAYRARITPEEVVLRYPEPVQLDRT